MHSIVSHDLQSENIEEKVRWFSSLSLSERMEILCEFTDLILEANPAILDKKNAQSPSERIQILSRQ